MQMTRKTATKLLLVQWSRFQNVSMRLEGSTLFTGVNGSGKSTILDAITYLLTGNTQFNKAAKDRDRTVSAYVRGDTKSNGAARYLRTGEVVSYIAMEFWSPVENTSIVISVCIESANETSAPKSNWFICQNAEIEHINFTKIENKLLRITPRNYLSVNGETLKSADFFGRDRGVAQVLRALGLRCEIGKYRSKLLKMMAFNPENNIDQFIQECVLEPGKVESLKELREQKHQFEHINDMYNNLRESKKQLEVVEKKSGEYESKLRNLQIRELMLCYQKLRETEENEKMLRSYLKELAYKQITLEEQKIDLDKQYESANERCKIAESNDLFRGMQDSKKEMEQQDRALGIEVKQCQERLALMKRLQIRMTGLFLWVENFLPVTLEEKKYLTHLAEKEFSEDKKASAFLHFAAMIKQQNKIFESEEVHYKDDKKVLEDEIALLEEDIKTLKSNQMIFPKKIQEAKTIICREFEKQGIQTEVRLVAELVQEIKDREWQKVIETFLGWKRFYIIVDGKNCHKAMEILEQKAIHGVNVVLTDKLPDTEITSGSAAEMLVVPNIFARRYVNYLLNGIHLCNNLKELHDHPKGGLQKNGMLAKSYSVTYLEIERVDLCLGADAIKQQLERVEKKKLEKNECLTQIQMSLEQVRKHRNEIEEIDWDANRYDFRAASVLDEQMARREKIKSNISKIRSNPNFLMISQEQEEAKQEYLKIKKAVQDNSELIGACKTDIENKEETLKGVSTQFYLLKQDYAKESMMHLELKRPMLDEYEKLREKKGTWQVVTQKTVQNLDADVKECIRQMENSQLNYCKLAEIDINKRGVAYISFYRDEYRNIANIKIEEAQQRLEEQAEKLESAFMNDFVAEINETVREAKTEIDAINRELKQIPFGNDTYKFMMDERADRSVFFRICKKLEGYMNSPEVYMNSARDDEEMEHDIKEFMSVILDEEDESEYTDYRKYFTYDMRIISKQGNAEIVADLSKKQGSASNGEKQTPYFIILAASLNQCYPRQVCCARLAFIDEAFSALSRERIEQMVKYFEENQFQVFYAAPPEKINSIGAYIESTVSLVLTGRYTDAIEGLVKGSRIYVQ